MESCVLINAAESSLATMRRICFSGTIMMADKPMEDSGCSSGKKTVAIIQLGMMLGWTGATNHELVQMYKTSDIAWQ